MLRWCSPWWHTNSQWMLNNCMQQCIQSLLAANDSFLSINICIQKLQRLPMSVPPLEKSSEWWMTSAYHSTALSASNWPHVDPYTTFEIYSPTSTPFLIQFILRDVHRLPYAISNISPMCTMSVQRVNQLDAETNAAWRSSFIPVCSVLCPLHLSLVRHHWVQFCELVLSLI